MENKKRKMENGKYVYTLCTEKQKAKKWKGEIEETATLVPPTLKLLYNRGSAAACTLQL